MPPKRPNRRVSGSGKPASNRPARPSTGRDKTRSSSGQSRSGSETARGNRDANASRSQANSPQNKRDVTSRQNESSRNKPKESGSVEQRSGATSQGAGTKESKSVGKPSGKPANTKPRAGVKATPFQNIVEMVKWVDLVVEVLDARLPLSTRHPKADEIFGRKPRLLVLAKSDLADAEETRSLIENIKAETGHECILVSLKTSSGKGTIMSACVEATKEKLEALTKKGILPRPMRVCVVGLPNVGKSSLINWLIGQNRAKTGNKPGITRGTQWVRVHPKLELLDTPGILPNVSFSKTVRDRLAICNLIPDSTYDRMEIAEQAILALRAKYPRLLDAYIEGLSADGTGLYEIATARNLLTSGAKPDVPRAAALLLSELRDGKVGRITLDP